MTVRKLDPSSSLGGYVPQKFPPQLGCVARSRREAEDAAVSPELIEFIGRKWPEKCDAPGEAISEADLATFATQIAGLSASRYNGIVTCSKRRCRQRRLAPASSDSEGAAFDFATGVFAVGRGVGRATRRNSANRTTCPSLRAAKIFQNSYDGHLALF